MLEESKKLHKTAEIYKKSTQKKQRIHKYDIEYQLQIQFRKIIFTRLLNFEVK